ncbi:MAG: MFS transporter [Acidobacteriota bacterium]
MTRLLPILAGLAFISLGLPDGLLGVAWPSIRASFGLPLDALGVLLIAGTAGYVASSFSSGRVLRRVNLGTVLAASCGLTAAGLLGYATAPQWPMMVALGVVLGLGAGAIDSGLNAYVATHYGPRTLNWLHACYGIGAATGPIIMTAVLERGQGWRRGYAIVAAAQVVLAVCFALSIAWWPPTGGIASHADHAAGTTISATLKQPAARLGIVVFVAYAGLESSIGAWTYTLLTAGRGVPPVQAGIAVTLFFGSLTGGRLLAAIAGGRVSVTRLLNLAIAGVMAGAVLIWLDLGTGWTFAAVAIAGCSCGPIFPTLVATTPARLGPAHATNAVGFQIAAAAVGLSTVPGLVGIIADRLGVEIIATLFVALALLLAVVCGLLDSLAPLKSTEPSVS